MDEMMMMNENTFPAAGIERAPLIANTHPRASILRFYNASFFMFLFNRNGEFNKTILL